MPSPPSSTHTNEFYMMSSSTTVEIHGLYDSSEKSSLILDKRDRYTNLWHILGWNGSLFSHAYRKIYWAGVELCSKVLDWNGRYYGFISYDINTDRTHIFLAIAAYFSINLAFTWLFIIIPVIYLILLSIPDPCVDGSTAVVYCGKFGEWIWFPQFLGAAVLVVTVYSSQVVFGWRKFWIDRLCLDQLNREGRLFGLRMLPRYLAKCENFFMFVDEHTFSNFYNLHNLCVYSMVRKRVNLHFVMVTKYCQGLSCAVVYSICFVIVLTIEDGVRHRRSLTDTVIQSMVVFIGKIFITTMLYFAARKQFRIIDSLHDGDIDISTADRLEDDEEHETLLKQIDVDKCNVIIKNVINRYFPRTNVFIPYLYTIILSLCANRGVIPVWSKWGVNGNQYENFAGEFFFQIYFWFVVTPFSYWILGSIFKGLYKIETSCGGGRFAFVVGLPVLYVFDVIFPVRTWLVVNFLTNVASALFLADYKWVLASSPLSFLDPFFLVAKKPYGLGWLHDVTSANAVVHLPVWSVPLLWIYLVVMAVVTYLVYESVGMREWRKKLFKSGSESVYFGQQFFALLYKQFLLVYHRKYSALTIFCLCGAIQWLSSWGWIALVAAQHADGGKGVNPITGGPFAMLLIVFWGCYVLRVSGDLCTEKRNRIRESLRMMGMYDFPYYLSTLTWAILEAVLFFVLACVAAAVMAVLVRGDDPKHFVTLDIGVYVIEWGLFVFMLHMLAVVFAMAMSTFFVSVHGSKVVFVIWALNLLPALGMVVDGLNWKNGWRFLPGEYIVQMLNHALADSASLGGFIREFWLSAVYVAGLFFLYCYLDQVIPHGEGRVRPFYFPFTSAFWKSVFDNQPEPTMNGISNNDTGNPNVEIESDPDLILKANKYQCVKTSNVHVEYDTDIEKTIAVDNLNLTMYEGQIFVLLGQNGAGKSSTMHCLSGLIQPTSGSINAYGLSIPEEIDFVRKDFGFCPQHNQLFNVLTVKDHLQLYARLRFKIFTDDEYDDYIRLIGLEGLAHQPAGELSGGQKRKLSVGIAFIGDPKFVILDEPSSGMDTFARRQLWEFLKSRRKGKVIMITTHFMDEADAIADRVAVLKSGKLQVMGSPAFLKKRFGCGYMIIAAPRDASQTSSLLSKLQDIAYEHLGRNAPISFLTQGKEVVVRMPFVYRGKVPGILDELEDLKRHGMECSSYGLSVSNLEEVFLKIASGHDSNIESNPKDTDQNYDALEFDPNRRATFKNQFNSMLYRRVRIGMRSKVLSILGVLVPILLLILAAVVHRLVYGDPSAQSFDVSEGVGRVFGALMLAGMILTVSVAFLTVSAADFAVMERSLGVKDFLFINGCGYLPYWLSNLTWDVVTSFPWLVVCFILWGIPYFTLQEVLISEPGWFVFMFVLFVFTSAFFAYILSQMLTTQWKSVMICLLFNGLATFICALIYITNLHEDIIDATTDDHRKTATEKTFNIIAIIVDVVGFFFPTYALVSFLFRSGLRSFCWVIMSNIYSRLLTEKFIIPNGVAKAVGIPSVVPDGDGNTPVFVWTSTCSENEGLIAGQYQKDDDEETSWNKKKVPQCNQTDDENGYFYTTALTACAWQAQIPYRKFTDTKFSSYTFHNAIESAWPGMMTKPNPPQVLNDMSNSINDHIDGKLLSNVLYRTNPTTYKIEKPYNSWTKPQQNSMLTCISSFIRGIGIGASIENGLLSYCKEDTLKNARNIEECVGGFAGQQRFDAIKQCSSEYDFTNCIDNFNSTNRNLFTEDQDTLLDACMHSKTPEECIAIIASSASPYLRKGLGPVLNTTYAMRDLLRGIGLLVLTCAIAFSWEWIRNSQFIAGLNVPKDPPETIPPKDFMVIEEEQRVESTPPQNNIIHVQDLRRVYKTETKLIQAVRGISFQCQQGEIFGLLGTNGAGKTSSFKMLCGITVPSEGTITLLGHDIQTDKHAARRMIGYCPQFDALWPKLTVYETLIIYASLRGYTPNEVDTAVTQQINNLLLAEYKYTYAGDLSGGNKRKLSVAIALIGMPPIIFLDEATTGVDPLSRRFMWSVIQNLRSKRPNTVIILTTHSMEEAQNLCERIAIQVDGSFRCLGTAQEIKDIHGSGYELSIRFAPPKDDTPKSQYITYQISKFEALLTSLNFKIKDGEWSSLNCMWVIETSTYRVANLMRAVEDYYSRNTEYIEDWWITQVTLERVFNKFAMQSENGGEE